MKITELNIYPIKSLRPISLQSATLCEQGLAYDRRFVLLKHTSKDGYASIWVGGNPEMALFHCSSASDEYFTVSYRTPSQPVAPPHPSQEVSLDVPYEPDVSTLEKITFELHTDPKYPACRMPENFNQWFSDCFGFPVVLAYMGDVNGIRKADAVASKWMSNLATKLPAQSLPFVNFSDGSPLLIVLESSLGPLHERLNGEKAEIEKFRPNVVLSDESLDAWDEDYWAELYLPRLRARIIITANCTRCRSINVDLEKGRFGAGESGMLLKKMMKDRRVDLGSKWEPIFGRYGFPTSGGDLRVGDVVEVSVRNQERTVWNGVVPRLTKFAPATATVAT